MSSSALPLPLLSQSSCLRHHKTLQRVYPDMWSHHKSSCQMLPLQDRPGRC
uniref:Uncharacterized protein n=1 Tax=Triticum urartu TaxID=4572 RepID=A0A8R7JVH7_TRIUA